MSEEPRKRSRFDRTEPEPKRTSRFNRRSRSPSEWQSESRLSRSPLRKGTASPSSTEKKMDPSAAAAAAAARINAQIQAKKGIQQVDVPPIRSAASPTTPAKSPSVGPSGVTGEVYTQDGDYIKDIEINDLRNRYTLTKGPTQKLIKEQTGADVTTRGNYYPDKAMATAANPPLYLHVTSTTKEGLEKAVAMIDEMMKQELPNLVDERRFRRREPEQFERDELGRRKWPEERIPVDLEPIPGFNLRATVVGHGGQNVKYIQSQTGCRVQIKGRGSGFMEHATGSESDEPMYLHVASPDAKEIQRAKELCIQLLESVKQQYNAFKERGPSHQGGGGYSSHHDGGDRYGGSHRERGASYGGYDAAPGYGHQQSPHITQGSPIPGIPTPNVPANGQDYSAQYAQYYGGQDPYAAYGGYQAYMAMYYQYYQQQQQSGVTGPSEAAAAAAAASPSGVPGAPGVPPPPPPSEAPPPPPSNPPPSPGVYNAVPPPSGI